MTGPAYQALAHALDGLDAHTPCHSRSEWISDDNADQAYAAAHCAPCFLLDLCATAAAELKPTAGTWAGTTFPIPRKKRAA